MCLTLLYNPLPRGRTHPLPQGSSTPSLRSTTTLPHTPLFYFLFFIIYYFYKRVEKRGGLPVLWQRVWYCGSVYLGG